MNEENLNNRIHFPSVNVQIWGAVPLVYFLSLSMFGSWFLRHDKNICHLLRELGHPYKKEIVITAPYLKKNFGYYNRIKNEGQLSNTEVLQFFPSNNLQ